MIDNFGLTLFVLVAGIALTAGVLYFVIRAAIVSALERHALWRADGSFEVELERHRQRAKGD